MGTAAERFAQVADEAADIGARATFDVQPQLRRDALQIVEQVARGLQRELVHLDLARLDLDRFAPARLGVQRLAAPLERGIDRRALLDPAGQCTQGLVDPGMRNSGTSRSRNGCPSASSVSVTTPSRATVS